MREHVQGDNRDRQSGADPQPAAHVDEFGIGPRLGGDCQRLQGHAADWAAAWACLTDLGMHRAGVDGARCGGRLLTRRQVSFRGGGEFLVAAGGTEMEGAAGVLEAMARCGGIDCHSADRIGGGGVLPSL